MPKSWAKEILNAGFAIIHDKVMVIDPFSENSVVITASHNLGHKASFDNEENQVIVKGNKKLAQTYTTHILDVYDHFSFRTGSSILVKPKPITWKPTHQKELKNIWMQKEKSKMPS